MSTMTSADNNSIPPLNGQPTSPGDDKAPAAPTQAPAQASAPAQAPAPAANEITSENVYEEEKANIKNRREQSGLIDTADSSKQLVGLARSAGGIRSASFNPGI